MIESAQPAPGAGGAGPGAMSPGHGRAREDERELVAALRRGDESAFSRLVELHHPSMVRVARLHVESAAVAEEVAQEAWLGVIEGLDRFTGASSLKAWIFAIVANCAKTRGVRDRRTVPLSALPGEDEGGASVDPERFLNEGHPRWPGHWSQPPDAWSEDAVESRETLEVIAAAIEILPANQRAVITMRDVEGLGSDETCQVLGISEGNQRVLLHRARSKVRQAVEAHLRAAER